MCVCGDQKSFLIPINAQIQWQKDIRCFTEAKTKKRNAEWHLIVSRGERKDLKMIFWSLVESIVMSMCLVIILMTLMCHQITRGKYIFWATAHARITCMMSVYFRLHTIKLLHTFTNTRPTLGSQNIKCWAHHPLSRSTKKYVGRSGEKKRKKSDRQTRCHRAPFDIHTRIRFIFFSSCSPAFFLPRMNLFRRCSSK